MPEPVDGGPSQRYAQGVARGDWQDDPAQHPALRELDRLHAQLLDEPAAAGLFVRWRTPEAVPGLYLWGGVGRGKTFLIDLFYAGLPVADKQRTHFHRFMRDVHAGLRAHAGERDPLAAVARDWRGRTRLLVLDEFFVSDIGDAMLLGRLLQHLFEAGMVLVTSSNTTPRELYRDGLQRARFEPAIALIERHCRVLHLDSPTDYRLRALTRSPVYRAPLDAESDDWLAARWTELVPGTPMQAGAIEVEGRDIPVRAQAEGSAWFDFDALCEGPRNSADYIEIAREHHTLLLGGIPLFDAQCDDAARRFIALIDELYDRHVNLVCTAAATPPELYTGERLSGAFARTASRLIEMQSAEYLALEHRG